MLTGADTRDMQAFRVTNPSWVKYIQLHFLTHHGSEPVCALNDVRVYGKSAADDLEDRLAMETSQACSCHMALCLCNLVIFEAWHTLRRPADVIHVAQVTCSLAIVTSLCTSCGTS